MLVHTLLESTILEMDRISLRSIRWSNNAAVLLWSKPLVDYSCYHFTKTLNIAGVCTDIVEWMNVSLLLPRLVD